MPTPDSTLDELYTILADHGPGLTNGFTSHAPMVAEALVELGRPDAARRWVLDHLDEATPRPSPGFVIARWQAALGAEERFADWAEFMAAELRRLGWREGLDLWAGRLAPGFAAAATHGVLRTAHAARAVAARASEARLAELADGLALWASTYQPLPGRGQGRGAGIGSLEAALDRVPRIPASQRRRGGAITTALGVLADVPEFEGVIDWFDPGEDPVVGGRQLVRAFADMFLAQVRDHSTAIVFTHAVTSTAAVLSMAPLLRASTVRELLVYAWQAGAALLAAYGDAPVAELDRSPELDADIIAEAIAHGDDHVIKLSGACLRLREDTGDPLFAALPRRARALIPADEP